LNYFGKVINIHESITMATEQIRSIVKKELAYTCKSDDETDLITIDPYPGLA